MTHTKDEAFSTERALKLALEALEVWCPMSLDYRYIQSEAITAINEALAAPYVASQLVQEPVECMCGICKLGQRQWVGLTDDERLEVAEIDGADEWFWKVCKAIEARLKEKNT